MAKCRRISLLIAGAIFVLATFLSGGSPEAKDRFVLEDDRIFIGGDPGLEGVGRTLLQALPEIERDLNSFLGWKLVDKPYVLLVGDREEFERMVEGEPIAAFAVPKRHLVVLGVPMMEGKPYVLKETFEHEICHLVLHDHIRRDIPRWLDEGVCQWVSGSLGELLIGREGGLAGAVDLARHAVPLSKLEESFPGGKLALAAAYAQSRSVVDFIVSGHGKMGLLGILDRLERGDSIEDAVQGSLGKPLSTVEAEWRASLSTVRVWLIRIGEYLYEIVFFLAAVVSGVSGLVVMNRRKRRRLEEMDEEDAAEEEDIEEGDEAEEDEGEEAEAADDSGNEGEKS